MMLKLRTVFCVALLCGTALLNSLIAQNVTDAGKPFLAKTNDVFNFTGGQLVHFIESIRNHYGVDLNEVATIPPQMLRLGIPKMRIRASDLEAILNIYNDVSQSTGGTLGKWAVTRGLTEKHLPGGEIAAIQFVPPPGQKDDELAVQAFSLSMSQDEFTVLQRTISEEHEMLREQSANSGVSTPRKNRSYLHPDTGILVVSGSRDYVNLVSTIVRAYKERLAEKRAEEFEVRSSKPITRDRSKQ